MKAARSVALAGSVGLAVSFFAVAGTSAATASTTPAPPRVALRGSLTPAQERSHPAGSVAAKSTVSFDLLLSLRNAVGAQRFVREVSSPGSRLFHHYMSDAKWVSTFGPTKAALASAESWLRHEGFKIGSVPKTRLFVSATGSAAGVQRAFEVKLGYFLVHGHRVRLAKGTLSIPGSLRSAVSGVVGVNQFVATTALTRTLSAHASRSVKPNQEPAPPAGFRNPQPCSAYWGQKTDTSDSGSLYAP